MTVKSSGRFVWSSILDRLGGQLGLQRYLHRAGEDGGQAGQGQNLQLHGGSDTYQAFSQDTYTETSKTGHFDQGYEILFQTPRLLSGDTTPGRLAVNWCPPATTPPPHLRLVSGQTFMVQQLAGNRCRVSAYLTHFSIQSGKLYHHINRHCQKYKSMCGVDKFSKELDININISGMIDVIEMLHPLATGMPSMWFSLNNYQSVVICHLIYLKF